MKLDDSHPDYFLSDGTAETPEASAASDSDPRKITFDDTPSDPGKQHGEPKPASTEEPKRRSRLRRFVAWFIAAVAVVLCIAVYFRYFSPIVEDARMNCYIINVEKRGVLFKTYEADVVSEQSMTDTTRVYSRDLSFSVDDPQLARELQSAQGTGRLITVEYVTYSATVPWRGASKSVIVGAQF